MQSAAEKMGIAQTSVWITTGTWVGAATQRVDPFNRTRPHQARRRPRPRPHRRRSGPTPTPRMLRPTPAALLQHGLAAL
ncbi:hypothetical protein GCM10010451_64830 [Streptomyces virens]|uniref:Uncharacterized protein n=1 Tax=Streptomyces virens TaxID=285572 RepID=A0ABP6Q6D6_9ACTN